MILRSTVEGLLVIDRPTHPDARGFVREPFRLNELEEAVGAPVTFVQQNQETGKNRGQRECWGKRERPTDAAARPLLGR